VSVVFKVRDRATGLFASGGSFPHWSSVGKAWPNVGTLKRWLSTVDVYNAGTSTLRGPLPESWEVVEYNEGKCFLVSGLLTGKIIAENERLERHETTKATVE
jgi:hypothetical protein